MAKITFVDYLLYIFLDLKHIVYDPVYVSELRLRRFYLVLSHWGLNKEWYHVADYILKCIFLNEYFKFWLRCHWNVHIKGPGDYCSIIGLYFQARNHQLNPGWSTSMSPHASLTQNGLWYSTYFMQKKTSMTALRSAVLYKLSISPKYNNPTIGKHHIMSIYKTGNLATHSPVTYCSFQYTQQILEENQNKI